MNKATAIVKLMATAKALEKGQIYPEGAEADFNNILSEYHKAKSQESDSLPIVSGMFILFKGSAVSKKYWDCGTWTTDKAKATQYGWKEANERSSKLGCSFTDA